MVYNFLLYDLTTLHSVEGCFKIPGFVILGNDVSRDLFP
jgi:hypothetical protein